MAGEAIECAAELDDDQAFYSMTEKIFALSSITKDLVITAAGELGINTTRFTECLNSGKYTSKVQAQMSE